MSVALALTFGLVIGLLLSLIGGGGSILTVPVLVYILGLSAHEATTTSLVIVGLTALVGAIPHYRAGRVAIGIALSFGAAGIGGAFVGAWLNSLISGALLLLLFGVLMLVVAARMIFSRQPADPESEGDGPSRRLAPVLVTGFVVGVMTGVFGVGGGFLIVPALALILKMPMRVAVGTSLVVIAINSAAGFLAQARFGTPDFVVAGLFILGGFVGSALGSRNAGRFQDAQLARAFAVFVSIVGVYLIARNAFVVVA